MMEGLVAEIELWHGVAVGFHCSLQWGHVVVHAQRTERTAPVVTGLLLSRQSFRLSALSHLIIAS